MWPKPDPTQSSETLESELLPERRDYGIGRVDTLNTLLDGSHSCEVSIMRPRALPVLPISVQSEVTIHRGEDLYSSIRWDFAPGKTWGCEYNIKLAPNGRVLALDKEVDGGRLDREYLDGDRSSSEEDRMRAEHIVGRLFRFLRGRPLEVIDTSSVPVSEATLDRLRAIGSPDIGVRIEAQVRAGTEKLAFNQRVEGEKWVRGLEEKLVTTRLGGGAFVDAPSGVYSRSNVVTRSDTGWNDLSTKASLKATALQEAETRVKLSPFLTAILNGATELGLSPQLIAEAGPEDDDLHHIWRVMLRIPVPDPIEGEL